MIYFLVSVFFVFSNSVDAAPLSERQQVIMGTYISVQLPSKGNQLSEKVFATFRDLDSRLSTFKANSEITRLNRQRRMKVSEAVEEVISLSLEIARETNGAFDPTFESSSGDWKDIQILGQGIVSLKNNVRLNLGGIGKGYAVDKAKVALQVSKGVIAASGDIYCFHACSVIVRDPFAPDQFLVRGQLRKKGLAITTSGGYFRPGHLINSKTKLSTKEITSLTIIAKEKNAVLDGWATALATMTPSRAVAQLKAKPNWNWLIVSRKKDIYKSSQFSTLAAWEWGEQIKEWNNTPTLPTKNN